MTVDVPVEARSLPDEAAALIAAGRRRSERFFAARDRELSPLAGFVPCDYAGVYPVLRAIRDRHLAPGDRFLEWGSGFGVVASLAAQLGFQSSGIEIEPDLVDEARAFAEDEGLDVSFGCGSFLPEGGERFADRVEEFDWLKTGGRPGYDEVGREPEDFDVIFAYPWPGEEQVIDGLFDAYAADSALLVTDHGLAGVRVRRRTAGSGAGSADPG